MAAHDRRPIAVVANIAGPCGAAAVVGRRPDHTARLPSGLHLLRIRWAAVDAGGIGAGSRARLVVALRATRIGAVVDSPCTGVDRIAEAALDCAGVRSA